jgi:hypothetical protein
MQSPFILISAILALGLVYVMLPVATEAYRRYRSAKMLSCPDTGKYVKVALDARRAALTAVFGPAKLCVTQCTLWPERRTCRQACLRDARNQAILHTIPRQQAMTARVS